MKTHIFYTICFALLLTNAFGQSKMEIVKFKAKSETQSFSHTIEEDGLYDARIIHPDGSIVSSPIHKKEYRAGEELQFNYQSKYFQAGEYRIIISNDRGLQSHKSIIIESNRQEKIRLEREKYQKKAKKIE